MAAITWDSDDWSYINDGISMELENAKNLLIIQSILFSRDLSAD